ncbi:MAG: EamA family transporter [Rhodospirillaceae bacterium]|nr:EamA family transporter [Rhodospirillaceae bacterium]
MNPLVLLPVLAAAVMHASWNALLKTGADRFWWMTMFCVVDGLAGLALLLFLPLPAPASWPYILGSAALHVVYQFLLLRTYAKGDFSQTYPVARGSAPLLVALGRFLIVGEQLSAAEWLGVVVVSVGLAGLALEGGRFHREAAPAAFLTGVSIAAYSVVDGVGGRLSQSALAYLAWMSLIWSIVMLLIYVGLRGWRRLVVRPRREVVTAGAGGLIAIGGYGIIIWAMTVSPMGPVSALRETSVVFATVIARLFLKERPSPFRITACLIVAAGAVCLALG